MGTRAINRVALCVAPFLASGCAWRMPLRVTIHQDRRTHAIVFALRSTGDDRPPVQAVFVERPGSFGSNKQPYSGNPQLPMWYAKVQDTAVIAPDSILYGSASPGLVGQPAAPLTAGQYKVSVLSRGVWCAERFMLDSAGRLVR